MTEDRRVVTANLPIDLVCRLNEIAERMDRSKSWIVQQALIEWLGEEQRRYELTLIAMEEVEHGRTIPHEDVLKKVEERKVERRQTRK